MIHICGQAIVTAMPSCRHFSVNFLNPTNTRETVTLMPRRVRLRTYSKVQGPDQIYTHAGEPREAGFAVLGAALGHGKGFRRRMPLAVVAGQSRRARVNEAGEEVAPPLVCAAVDFWAPAPMALTPYPVCVCLCRS